MTDKRIRDGFCSARQVRFEPSAPRLAAGRSVASSRAVPFLVHAARVTGCRIEGPDDATVTSVCGRELLRAWARQGESWKDYLASYDRNPRRGKEPVQPCTACREALAAEEWVDAIGCDEEG